MRETDAVWEFLDRIRRATSLLGLHTLRNNGDGLAASADGVER